MTDPSPSPSPAPSSVPGASSFLGRRTLLTAALGVAGVVIALGTVASALPASIDKAIGAAAGSELQQAERIVPSTTTPETPDPETPDPETPDPETPDPETPPTSVPADGPEPPPAGMIAFPIDAEPDCSISDNFGDYRSPTRTHEGLDIMGSRDADIYAVATGRLTKQYVATPGRTYGAGNGWTLHDETNDVYYRYFHLGTHAPGLVEGDIVEFGTVIGTVGNTGTSGANSDSNFHLHFEYRPNNQPVDPRPLLVRHPNCTFF